MAGDLFQAAVQSLSVDDIAVSVLATVISHNRARSLIVVDAGGLALSKDRSTTGRPGKDAGFGAVVDLAARPSYGDLHIDDVHQEHGEIHGVSAAVFSSLPIGARVRILPNHACMTAAMYHEYLITDGKEEIIERWPRTNGWS
jgi:D-serine deaminase-like pyridoxal phosphate-dependent protein